MIVHHLKMLATHWILIKTLATKSLGCSNYPKVRAFLCLSVFKFPLAVAFTANVTVDMKTSKKKMTRMKKLRIKNVSIIV